jgi:septal ring factor EnvC (AmiA/AmiB activator)
MFGRTMFQEGSVADWASDVITKAMFAACTVLLGIAVNSLQSMNKEIKDLSASVFELSSQSKVLNVTIANLERRLDKLEHASEKKP